MDAIDQARADAQTAGERFKLAIFWASSSVAELDRLASDAADTWARWATLVRQPV